MTDATDQRNPRATVITVSDRCAAGEAVDVSGPLAQQMLVEAGWDVDVVVVPDERERITWAIMGAVEEKSRLVITTGGTGVGPRDVTPEATASLLNPEVPGIAETIRSVGVAVLPQAMLSRGRSGIVDGALVVNLAGSTGAVKDGVPVILQVASHVVSQVDGGDHVRLRTNQ